MSRLWIAGVLLVTFTLPAQAQEELVISEACSYYGETVGGKLYGFDSDQSADRAVGRIMNYTGLPKNFDIKAANVPNAAAVVKDDKRLILYSQTFMERLKKQTATDWAAVSILAHEIGHHLSGHTLLASGSRPKTELEADKFSGHVLYKMGSALGDAQAAMNALSGDTGSRTHPPKSARLAAIASGWTAARDQAGASGGASPDPVSEPEPVKRKPPSRPDYDIEPDYPLDDEYYDPVYPTGPQIVGRCQFVDGGVAQVYDTGQIVMNYLGQEVQVAQRIPSMVPQFAWIYRTLGDPSMEAMANMLGMSTATEYGVDGQGIIWGQNPYNGYPMQVGQCQ